VPVPVGKVVEVLSDVSAPGAPAAMTVPDVARELPVYQLAAALGSDGSVSEVSWALHTADTAASKIATNGKMEAEDLHMVLARRREDGDWATSTGKAPSITLHFLKQGSGIFSCWAHPLSPATLQLCPAC